MVFDDKIGKYVDEYNGLVFTWENPDEDRTEDEKRIAENYYSHIDDIAGFMHSIKWEGVRQCQTD